jgi:hypothetical protein
VRTQHGPWPQELRALGSVREDDDPVLAVNSALDGGRDHRLKHPLASPPPVYAPDATWRVEEARRLGLDKPRTRQPVNQHQCRRCRKRQAYPDRIGDHEGNHPSHDGPHRGDDRQRSQREQGDRYESPDLGVD